MADTDTVTVVTAPEPVFGAPFDVTAVLAGIDAEPVEPAPAAADTAVSDTETPVTDTELAAKPAEPAPVVAEPAAEQESAALTAARKVLAVAAKKEAKALNAVKDAEAALLQQFRDDPAAFLARSGDTVQSFLRKLAAAGGADEDKPATADDRVAKLEKLLEEQTAAQSRAAQLAEVKQMTAAIHASVKAAPEFTRINKQGLHDLVTDEMQSYYGRHGKPTTWQAAAAKVEKALRHLAGDATPFTAAKTAPATSQKPTSAAGQQSVTLTNNNSGEVNPDVDDLPTDPDERLRAYLKRL